MKRTISTTAVLGLLFLAGCRSSMFGSGAAAAPEPGSQATEAAAARPDDGDGETSRPRPRNRRLEHTALASERAAPRAESESVLENLHRGNAEYRQNRLDRAKMHYLRVLREQPDHAQAHHLLGIIADKQQDFATAEHHYSMAYKRIPGDADLLSDIGYSCFLQGRHEESETWLNDALRIDPQHPRATRNLGLLYGTAGDFERAYAMFRRVATEREAQMLMNRLASQHRQGGDPADSRLARQAGGPTRLHPPDRHAPDLHAPDPTATGPHQVLATASHQTIEPAPNETTQQLKEMMNRAAQRDIAARNHRSQQAAPQTAWTGPPGEGQAFGPGAYSHDAGYGRNHLSQPPSNPHPHRTAAAYDGEVNHAFRGTDPRTQARSPEQPVVTVAGQQHVYRYPADEQPQPRQSEGTRHAANYEVWPPEDLGLPQYPPSAAGPIRQLDYQQEAGRAVDEASRRALRLGHNAGPGGMFPMMEPGRVGPDRGAAPRLDAPRPSGPVGNAPPQYGHPAYRSGQQFPANGPQQPAGLPHWHHSYGTHPPADPAQRPSSGAAPASRYPAAGPPYAQPYQDASPPNQFGGHGFGQPLN